METPAVNASVAGFLAAMAFPVDVLQPFLAAPISDPPAVDVLQPPRRTGPRKPRAYEVARKAATEAKRAAVEARSRATDDMDGAGSGATVAAAVRGNGNASNGFPRHRIVATDSLIGYDNNPRTHSPAQVDQLVASIREFGFTNPILTDGKKGVVAGHGRLLAAEKMGLATVPTLELSHLNAKQRRAYVIADNKLAMNAGWDNELLALELGDLRDDGFDLSLIGFDDRELFSLFGDQAGLTDPDDAPPVPEVPVTVLGDVWLLGRHRLVCGDSTTAASVEAALAGSKPHLMVTDPPYGVEYDAAWRQRAGVGGTGSAIGKVLNDGQADWREAWALFPGAVAYVWHGGLHGPEVADSLAACKFKVRAQIVWVKPRAVLSRGDYHWQHEPVFNAVREGEDDQWRFVPEHEVADYSVRAGTTGHWEGSRKQSTVWFIEHIKSETGHSTQKPVDCMKRPITNNSGPGQAVYDPFLGSGTTVIAAEMTGRVCIGIELSPAYVDVSVRRWQAFVGAEATLEGDGRTFAAIEAARAAPAAGKRAAARKPSAALQPGLQAAE
jgi:DNA modification methylase